MGEIPVILLGILLVFYSNPADCIKLLYNGQIAEAKQLYQQLDKSEQSDNMRFLNAYFDHNSDKVIPVYTGIYEKTVDDVLKYLTAKKLYEYHYARGLYTASVNYQTVMNSIKSDPQIEISNDNFVIQCGVFTAESNALALKEKVSSVVKNNVYLKATIIDGDHFIRVLVGDFKTVQDAEKVQNTIQQKLLLSTMIKSKNP
ncbi:MAG: SPOR domain-containing protein [Calditrichaeota bacterium]|nr:SPOR domain-containing protein [Calditrichota bacterium]